MDLDKIDAQFKRMDVSVESSFTIMTNSLTRAVGQFDKATGASDALGRSIRSIGEAIDKVDWAAVGNFLSNSTTSFRSLRLQLTIPDLDGQAGGDLTSPEALVRRRWRLLAHCKAKAGPPRATRRLKKALRTWADAVIQALHRR